MRRIYLVVFIISLAIVFYGGYRTGSSESSPIERIDKVSKERDSLSDKLYALQYREDTLKQAFERTQKKIKASDSLVKVIEKHRISKTKLYEGRISKMKTATIPEIDSFFVATYPVKDSTKNSINISEAKARAIVLDRIRLDSIKSVSQSQDSTILQQNSSITIRDSLIHIQHETIVVCDSTTLVVKKREETYKIESEKWQITAKKYKRQRNHIIAGVGIVVLVGIIKFFLP